MCVADTSTVWPPPSPPLCARALAQLPVSPGLSFLRCQIGTLATDRLPTREPLSTPCQGPAGASPPSARGVSAVCLRDSLIWSRVFAVI